MRLPSFSIAEMMAIIVLVALDCLVIRARQQPLTWIYLVVGGLPMQSALVSGLFLMFRRRRLSKKWLPFLIGFEVVGWISFLMYVDLCFRAPIAIDQHLQQALNPLLGASGSGPFSLPVLIYRSLLAMSYLTAPQLVVALIAGWISHWWWKRTHPETPPTQD